MSDTNASAAGSLADKENSAQSIETDDAREAVQSPQPDGGYGWVCLLAYFCVNAFTWGVVAVS